MGCFCCLFVEMCENHDYKCVLVKISVHLVILFHKIVPVYAFWLKIVSRIKVL